MSLPVPIEQKIKWLEDMEKVIKHLKEHPNDIRGVSAGYQYGSNEIYQFTITFLPTSSQKLKIEFGNNVVNQEFS